MVALGLDFTQAKQRVWEQERANLYAGLHPTTRHSDLFREIQYEHAELTQRAFYMAASGVQTVEVSDNEKLLLSHTSPTSYKGLGVALVKQTTLVHDAGNTDTVSRTIAVFGERIDLKADVESAGRTGFGVWAAEGAFLGIGAVRHYLSKVNGPKRVSYIPYDQKELDQLAILLDEFKT